MKTYITGVLTKLDQPNANDRIYPSCESEEAIERAKLQIFSRSLFSEFLPDTRTSHTVNLDNVGGVVKTLFIENDNLCATVEVIPTKMGNEVLSLLDDDLKVMLSLKAYGTVSLVGNEQVINDLNFISIDVLPFDNVDSDLIASVVKEKNENII